MRCSTSSYIFRMDEKDPQYKEVCPGCSKVLGMMVGIYCLTKNGEEQTVCSECGQGLMTDGWNDINADEVFFFFIYVYG